MTDKLRVLLVDDSVLFLKGLSGLFARRQDMELAGEARDGLEALEKARELMPDIILMDINMPRCNGVDATRLIKKEMPATKVVMLTVSESDQHLFESIKAGAQGYLLKNMEPEELFNLLQGVARGEAPISPSMAAKILTEFTQHDEAAPARSASHSHISLREREVLELVVAGKTNKEIARQLAISESTVKNHLRNIMEKLHVANRVQLALQALQQEGIQPPQT